MYTLDRDDVPDLFLALPGEWAASFDGIDDYVVIPNHPDFNGNEFSVEFWAKQPDTGRFDAMLDKGAPDTDFHFATQDGTPVTVEPGGHCVSMIESYLSLTTLPDIFNGPNGTISDFTIELWVKPDLADYEGTLFEITKATGGEGNYVRLVQQTWWRHIYLMVGDDAVSGDWSTRERVGGDYGFCTRPDAWYHIAATFDAGAAAGSRLKLYINGIEQDRYGGSLNPSTAGQATFFSQTSYSSRLDAQMDEIRIWNVPRTQAEIVTNMHQTFEVAEIVLLPKLLHYYKLDEPLAVGDPLEHTAVDSAGLTTGPNPGTFRSYGKTRVTSSVPLGTADADTQIEADGTVAFPAADLSLDYSEQDAATVTAVKLTTHPNTFPADCRPFAEQYWIVYRDCDDDDYWISGGSTPYVADFTFSLAEDLTADDALARNLIALYRRDHTFDGQWDLIGTASVVDADNDTVTFEDVSFVPLVGGAMLERTQSSQFLVGRRVGQGVVFGIGQGPGLGNRQLSYIWGDDAWHHVCGTYSATGMRLYIDGSLVGTAPVTAQMTANDIRIGAFRDGSGLFSGWLDELRYWSRALSDADVGFYYDKELRGNEPGLVGYWKFSEGGGGVIGDSTGNGHDAELYNGLARDQHDNDYVSLPVGDYALSLDSDTLVYVGGIAGLSTTLSIEAWVRKTEATTNPAVFSLGNGALTVYAGHNGSERMAYYDANNGWIESGAVVPVGEWHHLAWTLQKEIGQGGFINFYLDGELADQMALNSDLPSFIGDALIGCADVGVDPFIGDLTEIRL